jgi:hypothetical protein
MSDEEVILDDEARLSLKKGKEPSSLSRPSWITSKIVHFAVQKPNGKVAKITTFIFKKLLAEISMPYMTSQRRGQLNGGRTSLRLTQYIVGKP